jgi:DNA-binding transcriptional MerR regulator
MADTQVTTPAANADESFLFIGELAKQTGIDPKTIRFYERAELLSPPRHGKFRTYLASDVRRLQNILRLRRLGVPIAQIRDILERVGDCANILEIEPAVTMLRNHLDVLRTKHVEITRQIEQTTTIVQTRAA